MFQQSCSAENNIQSQEHVCVCFFGHVLELNVHVSTFSPWAEYWPIFFLAQLSRMCFCSCCNSWVVTAPTGALGNHSNSTNGGWTASFSELTWFQFPAAGGRTQRRKVAGPRQSVAGEPPLAACSASPAPGCTETLLSARWGWDPRARTSPLSPQASCPSAGGRKARKRAFVPFPYCQTLSCPPGEDKRVNRTAPEHQLHLQQWEEAKLSSKKRHQIHRCEANIFFWAECLSFLNLHNFCWSTWTGLLPVA